MLTEEQDLLRQVQIASVQSIIRREAKPKNISLIVVDEAHHIKARTNITPKIQTTSII